MDDLCMIHLQYSNHMVVFMVNLPWKESEDDFDWSYAEPMEYLRDQFGLDPMKCTDATVEWG